MNNVIEVNDQNFGKEVTQAGGPVLVDFYAPWCGPCKMLAPALDKMAGELAGRVKFAKVNVEDASQLATRFRITGVPTLMVFHGDRVLDSIVGAMAPNSLKARLEQAAAACSAA
jgi:thioredoxin 1